MIIIGENEDYSWDATDFYKNKRDWFFGSAVNIEKSIKGGSVRQKEEYFRDWYTCECSVLRVLS